MRNNKIVAEINIRQIGNWFAWYVFAPGLKVDQAFGYASSRPYAMRAAADRVEQEGIPGKLGFLSEDGRKVTHVTLEAVP